MLRMLIKIYLCEEHHAKLKSGGVVKGGSRLLTTPLALELCNEEFCYNPPDWIVTIRLPEKKVIE